MLGLGRAGMIFVGKQKDLQSEMQLHTLQSDTHRRRPTNKKKVLRVPFYTT